MNNSHWNLNKHGETNDNNLKRGIIITMLIAFISPPMTLLSLITAIKYGYIAIIGISFLLLIGIVIGVGYIWKSDKMVSTKMAWTSAPVLVFILSCSISYGFLKMR